MSRYTGATGPQAAEGWQLSRVTPPSELFGANGMRFGPDGRIYVVQAFGSQVSCPRPDDRGQGNRLAGRWRDCGAGRYRL